ncbi:AMP-binding protein [Chryseobacterium arthrosphaerae]|uniref:AMP-binding protein n=1 Tax=Chryseobacterium arthrosphaerae TaxID=651561 RepID=UPI0021CF0923|nr:AMP-binding protein [Chryseobacterium arthrosphaerae]
MITGKISTSEAQSMGPAVLLSPEDREKLLHDFNKTGWDYRQEETLASLFRKQADLHPDHIAIVYQDQTMTYQELDQKSNQIANALAEEGVTEGMYVPVWVNRSLEWVVAVLGIVKTGAAYVPVDPAYPSKRVEYILSDTSAKVIITNNTLETSFSEKENIKVIDPSHLGNPDHFSSQPLDIKIHQDALAYTIYTSGSTGKPKGVMVTHRAIQHSGYMA